MPFKEEITQLTIQTRNHADVFNKINNELFENTKYNKEQHEILEAKASELEKELDAHNVSGEAHADIRELFDTKSDKGHTHDYEQLINKPNLDLKADKSYVDEQDNSLNTRIDEVSTHADDTSLHITEEERTKWNSKASTDVATTADNGLMSKEDKSKLDGIEANANNYIHPDNESTRHITDAERAKLEGIEAGANNYVHPSTSGNKHIPAGGTAGQILRWSADGTAVWGDEKASGGDGSGGSVTLPDLVTPTADGLMSKEDKTKLDGIEAGAKNIVLNNTVTSTSTTEGATANAVKQAYDKANHTHPYAPTTHSHEYTRFPISFTTSTGGAGSSTLYYDSSVRKFKYDYFAKSGATTVRKTYTIPNEDSSSSGGSSAQEYGLTYLNGWKRMEVFNGYPEKEIRKIGDMVHIHTVIFGGNTTIRELATLPPECVPATPMRMIAMQSDYNGDITPFPIYANPDGTINHDGDFKNTEHLVINAFYYLK